jgi:prefoldin alpha subunit
LKKVTEKTDDQRKMQVMLLQIQSYQSSLQDISRRLALLERTLIDFSDAIAAVGELPKSKESDALIPIGAGVFARAKLQDMSKLIVSVGSSVYLEKTSAEAKAYMEKQKEELQKNETLLREQATRINRELQRVNREAEDLYLKLQGQKP